MWNTFFEMIRAHWHYTALTWPSTCQEKYQSGIFVNSRWLSVTRTAQLKLKSKHCNKTCIQAVTIHFPQLKQCFPRGPLPSRWTDPVWWLLSVAWKNASDHHGEKKYSPYSFVLISAEIWIIKAKEHSKIKLELACRTTLVDMTA